MVFGEGRRDLGRGSLGGEEFFWGEVLGGLLFCSVLLCSVWQLPGGAWTAESVTDVVAEGMVDSLARGA